MEDFITRQKARASKAVMAQSKAKQLDKMGKMEDLENRSSLAFNFNTKKHLQKLSLKLKISLLVTIRQSLFLKTSPLSLKGKCLGIIGKNGKGKSTLLNAIAELPLQNGEDLFSS